MKTEEPTQRLGPLTAMVDRQKLVEMRQPLRYGAVTLGDRVDSFDCTKNARSTKSAGKTDKSSQKTRRHTGPLRVYSGAWTGFSNRR
jgi:hypothetical protein